MLQIDKKWKFHNTCTVFEWLDVVFSLGRALSFFSPRIRHYDEYTDSWGPPRVKVMGGNDLGGCHIKMLLSYFTLY